MISLTTLFQQFSVKFGLVSAEAMLKSVMDGIKITSQLSVFELVLLYMCMIVFSLNDGIENYPKLEPYWKLLRVRLTFMLNMH